MEKGVAIVLVANILNMIFSVVTSFILPKYLSIDSYGYYKIFQLYANYLGILHLGFVDGIYLKYGGKEIDELDFSEVRESAATIRNLQLLMSVCAVFVSVLFKNEIAIFLSLSLVPINMIAFYKNLYQATGRFKDYGFIISLLPTIMFLCNIILLFFIKSDNYLCYIFVSFISNLFLFFYSEIKGAKKFGRLNLWGFNIGLLKENIRSGLSLTIGNFASIFITSIDRWCIQWLMSIKEFSYYSFAVSVENLFNVCLSAVTTTLYNYLCKEQEVDRIVKIKNYCAIIGVYMVSIAFAVKFVIQYWLSKYDSSIKCMFILICAHSFYFVIKAIYVNLYKARGQQKHYLCQMIEVFVIALVLNLIGYYCISKTKEVFAYASLLTAIIWFFICWTEFKDIRGKGTEIIVILISSCIFLVSGNMVENSWLGFAIYFASTTIILYMFEKTVLMDFFKYSFEFLAKKVSKEK